MNKTKIAYVLEITWAVIALITLGIALHSTFTNGFDKSIIFCILTIVSFFMFFIRRHRRINGTK